MTDTGQYVGHMCTEDDPCDRCRENARIRAEANQMKMFQEERS